MNVLYEDNHLIAVQKSHGMLTQGDDTNDPNLLDEVKIFIKDRDQKPGNVFLGLLHRLDRPVGGVVLFAKTSKGASRLSEQFRNHTIEKTYWAVVGTDNDRSKTDRTDARNGAVETGRPSPSLRASRPVSANRLANASSGTVIQWLRKDEQKNFVEAFDHEVPGSLRAELAYKILKQDHDHALVEIKPKTGRPHQIRVAMSSLGMPIAGDVKYGSKESLESGKALALFARSLSFDHPITKERVTVIAESELSIFNVERP